MNEIIFIENCGDALGQSKATIDREKNLSEMSYFDLKKEFHRILRKLKGNKFVNIILSNRTKKEYLKKILWLDSLPEPESHFYKFGDLYERGL